MADVTPPEIELVAIWTREVLYLSLIAGGIGALGGAARFTRLYVDPPTPPTAATATAPWKRLLGTLFISAVAAVAAFYVLAPATPLKFIAAAVIAGYSGPALLDALEARMRVLVAEAKAAQAVSAGTRALDVAKDAIDAAKLPPADPARTAQELVTKVEGLRKELEAIKRG
jgi:hypothetical protein